MKESNYCRHDSRVILTWLPLTLLQNAVQCQTCLAQTVTNRKL